MITLRKGNVDTILYFGNTWAGENRTSSHHIAQWLSHRYHVYYIECPGMRPPVASGRDLKRIWQVLVRFLRGAQPMGELKVWSMLQLPFHRIALVRRLNRVFITAALRWLMWREGITAPICWHMVPHMASIHLGEKLTVYYCTDAHAAMPGVDATAVKEMDEELTRHADLVFVTAATLQAGKLVLNPETRVSPHGVDFDHFSQAQDAALPIAPDVADLPGPVVGFFGLIERWIDLDLIRFLAEQRPQWSFVMIGRVAVPTDELPRLPNIYFLGKRPYESLPSYGKRFDVALIPHKLNQTTHFMNPLKLREYLAMGKPVVSVGVPEVEKFADVVEIARSPDQFLERIDAVLSRKDEDMLRRMNRVRDTSWDARLQEVHTVVLEALRRITKEKIR